MCSPAYYKGNLKTTDGNVCRVKYGDGWGSFQVLSKHAVLQEPHVFRELSKTVLCGFMETSLHRCDSAGMQLCGNMTGSKG